jgi:ribose transport system ATP-binding protein
MAAPGGSRPAGGGTPLVELRHVSKRFGATQALSDVTLGIEAGTIHCLLGENGAGKSTLGKIVCGVHALDAGEIWIDGERHAMASVAEARARGIGVVFQELSLAPDLTVRENICLGTERGWLPFALLSRRAEEAHCRRLLRDLDLDVDLAARVGDLPVATQQMVEIVKAMALRPRLVILDEPTAMIGAVDKQKLFHLLRRLKAEGTAFVFITHHIDEVVEIGDHASIMKDGVLVDSFPIDASTTADTVVERLVGRRVSRVAGRRGLGAAAEVLAIRGLPAGEHGPQEIHVRRGEIVGLYGVVGCGRERIVAALAGLDDLGGATMTLDGAPYRPKNPAAAARRGVAYLPSGRAANGILPSRTIRENLTLTQLRRFHRGGVIAARAERAAARDQLARLRTRFASDEDPITSLSGGNQQKVLLGRSLGHARRLLVLEDPTAGIDIAAKQELHELIRARADDGLAIVFISSELVETLTVCNAVYTIFKGVVCGEYRPPSLDDEPAILADVLGSARAVDGDGTSAMAGA